MVNTEFQQNVSLAPLTSMKLGGVARYYYPCYTVQDIKMCLKIAHSNGLKCHILGGGSNCIFSDLGFNGIICHIKTTGIEWLENGLVKISAGENWDEFVQQAIRHQLAGVSCLSGIPGSVGATPIQNVGAYGVEVKEYIVSVEAIDRSNGEEVEFANKECHFAYRFSRFKGEDKNRFIITSVTMQLQQYDDPIVHYPELNTYLESCIDWKNLTRNDKLQALRDAVINLRRRKGTVLDPLDPNSSSAGSFFMNPILTDEELKSLKCRLTDRSIDADPPVFESVEGKKVAAAWLVEKAGFQKGFTYEGVGISEKHALVLINKGSGTTRSLLQLAQLIQRTVKDQFNINLEREPEIISFS